MRQGWSGREIALFAAILAGGLLVRLPFAPVVLAGVGDINLYQSWAHYVAANGIVEAYNGQGINYPPLLLYYFSLVGNLNGPALVAAIKLPSMLADVLTGVLIALALPTRRVALIACAAYVFNPAIWLVSTYWGQSDAIYTLFLVAAVIALQRNTSIPAAVAWTLAIATKLQSIALSPLLLIAAIWRRRPRELALAAAASLATLALIFAPWIIAGRLPEAVGVYLKLPDGGPRVDTSAYNLWYLLLLGEVHNASSADGLFGLPVSYQASGVVLFALFCALIVFFGVRRRNGIALIAAALSLGLFNLLTQMHERYIFPALAFLLLALGERLAGKAWLAYGVVSLTFWYNISTIVAYPPFPPINLIAAPTDSSTLTLKIIALLAAAANVGVLVWLTSRVVKNV